jgi:O-antigen/teichoic acid export membrane protein
LAAKGLNLFVWVWLTRSLGPESWGRMQWAQALAALAAAAAEFGLSSLALREIASAPSAKRASWVAAALRVKALLWLGVGLLYGSWISWAPAEHRVLLLSALAFSFSLSLAELNKMFFAGAGRLDQEFYVSVLSKSGQALAALAGLLAGFGPSGILLCMASAGLLGWAFGLLRLRGLALGIRKAPWKSEFQALLNALWPYGLAGLVGLAAGKLDTLMLEQARGAAEVGVYQGAYKWLEAIAMLPVAFVFAFYPTLASASAKGDSRLEAAKALRLLGCMAALAAAFLWALAPLLPLILGGRYSGSAPFLKVLALSCLATFPNYALSNLLMLRRRQNRLLAAMLIALAVNAGLNLVLIPAHGALGASWATVATEAAVTASALGFLSGVQEPWPALGIMGKAALAAGAGILAGWGLGLLEGAGSLLAPLLAPLAALLACLGLGLLSLEFFKELLKRASQALGKGKAR